MNQKINYNGYTFVITPADPAMVMVIEGEEPCVDLNETMDNMIWALQSYGWNFPCIAGELEIRLELTDAQEAERDEVYEVSTTDTTCDGCGAEITAPTEQMDGSLCDACSGKQELCIHCLQMSPVADMTAVYIPRDDGEHDLAPICSACGSATAIFQEADFTQMMVDAYPVWLEMKQAIEDHPYFFDLHSDDGSFQCSVDPAEYRGCDYGEDDLPF